MHSFAWKFGRRQAWLPPAWTTVAAACRELLWGCVMKDTLDNVRVWERNFLEQRTHIDPGHQDSLAKQIQFV
jgi:hypothetical protein